ncbi:hypothetical protein AB7C87_04845 [Natrarchaeobius sp. A-rgal3]|uniref:hypothetical protein n=1 Tax=Natrarchaeobius versutus TaxID=1679078 RepID=UPI0035109E44
MTSTERQRKFARRAMWVSVLLGILGCWFFLVRGEPIMGLVLGVLLGGGGYWEYKRRIRDLDVAEGAAPARDPFEERERRR